MINRYLIVLMAVLSTSCALFPPYKPTPETLGPNPATLKVSEINTSDITHSSMSILRHEVNCKKPGKTTAKITNLGYTENDIFKYYMFDASSMEPPYSVQIPGNQQIIIDLRFIKEYVGQSRECAITFSFLPEAGAVYQLDRAFDTGFGNLGGCSFDIAKVVAMENGKTMKKLKDYRWSILAGFEHETFMCDDTGNYAPVPRKRMRTLLEKVNNAPDGPLWKETYIK